MTDGVPTKVLPKMTRWKRHFGSVKLEYGQITWSYSMIKVHTISRKKISLKGEDVTLNPSFNCF